MPGNMKSGSSHKRPSDGSAERPTKRPRVSTKEDSTPCSTSDTTQQIPRYINNLSDEQKTRVFDHIKPSLDKVAYSALRTIAVEHKLKIEKRTILLPKLSSHSCSWSCMVRLHDAVAAGVISTDHCSADFVRAVRSDVGPSEARQQRRTAERAKEIERDEADKEYWEQHWPQVESSDMLKQIMREHRNQTTGTALQRHPCSFCNRNEYASKLRCWEVHELDITLLDTATTHLQSLLRHPRLKEQPPIQSHRLHNGKYQACPTCRRCIKDRKFVKLPLLSWANGCWIGDVPDALSGLTYAESLVIARAHTTKCWAKINAGSNSSGVFAQRAASGNVCIHPHEITNLANRLPRPISTLYDEIVVMIVSDDQAVVTPELFKQTPFLVRRERILRALLWLKEHNRLYVDIEIDEDALKDYPDEEHDGGVAHFPVQHQHASDTIRGQSATYTGHGVDTTEAMFAMEHPESDSQIPISVTGTFDVDDIELTIEMRKIQALRHLKANGDFVKTSTLDETLRTRDHPEVYGMLWPTLFPYGVGMFEDPIRYSRVHGFKPIPLKTHVQRYLQLADRRFQTHLSFIFAMHNIQMLRCSSFQSRLAVRRAWWPSAKAAMEKIDDEILAEVSMMLANKKARKDYSKWEPTTEVEQAVSDLLKYVDYVTDHIEGSTADVMAMREEIHALCRDSGTPSIFFTLNPADNYNPLMSFTAGNDINLDALFSNPDSRFTPFDRARTLAANPVAGAEFFKTVVDQFTDVFLGFERDLKRGVFGRVKHYYGVVEAQNRGSLHLHILVWLEGAMSPRLIHETCIADPAFRTRLFTWLDSVFVHDLPMNTIPAGGSALHKKACLLGRPPHPDSPDFDLRWPQYLREVLDASGQINTDRLCRFNLPEKPVADTFMDDNGKIHMKRLDGRVVGHTPVISGSFQCNTDSKFVGSGPFGMALSVYMCNYTTKATLDSAIVMSALCAATKAMKAEERAQPQSDDEERCRRLLLKTLNQINGRRELSGQQVASALLGIPNHVTNARFAVFYWSKLLTWLSSSHFPPYRRPSEGFIDDLEDLSNDDPSMLDAGDDDDSHLEIHIDNQRDYVLLNDNSLPPRLNSLIYDVLLRPPELESLCMWDQFGEYEKVLLSSGQQRGESCPDTELDDEGNGTIDENPDPPLQILHFSFGHPQADTHGLRKRHIRHIPVLSGYAIPQRDLPAQAEKYSIAMLALFQPWSRSVAEPLKLASVSWTDALATLLRSLPKSKLRIIDHMQEQWECRLAADDFSARQKQRLVNFQAEHGFSFSQDNEETYTNDIEWQLGQQDISDGNDSVGNHASVAEAEDYDDFCEVVSARLKKMTTTAIALAESVNCYKTQSDAMVTLDGRATEADENAHARAQAAKVLLAAERATVINAQAHNAGPLVPVSQRHTRLRETHIRHPPYLTNLEAQRELLQQRIASYHASKGPGWSNLERWKQLAIAVVDQFTLNRKQKLAFLLTIDNCAHPSRRSVNRSPFRMIIGGSGGTGKSHIYEALRLFFRECQRESELKFTAPTGVAATNVHGSTIHFETCLHTKDKTLLQANSKALKVMADRFHPTKMLIIDEFFFLGCADFEKLSRNLNLARRSTDDAFGHLDLLLSGDEYQLTSPGTKPLFAHEYVSREEDSSLQALSAEVRRNLTAIKNYWSIENCVILDDVVRQKNPRFVALLNRLRRGMCTVTGDDNDLDYLRQFRLGSPQSRVPPGFTDISKWIQSPEDAAPLITYTNSVRNAHNWNMTKAFATATNQEFAVYYGEDTVGRGSNKTLLRGQNARDAWDTPVKSHASDLAGRLPLVIGMPIFVVDNLAVELGVANGSGGTLVSLEYEVKEGRRYALSAEVDLPRYTSSDPYSPFPHRVRIPLVTKSIKFKKRLGTKLYSALRSQLPLIPGFAFTAHNSQSRSLDAGIIHLESCTVIAAAYVMLSRIKCDENGPTGLAILGEVSANKICNHAPAEVRNEEKRLKKLAKKTLEKAKETLNWYTQATGEVWDFGSG